MSALTLGQRLIGRLARELVSRAAVPPRLLAYRYVPKVSPRRFDYRVIEPATVVSAPLPRNVASRELLNRRSDLCGFSFYDVPERAVNETYVVTIPNCKILAAPDEWNDLHYAIVTDHDRAVDVRGTAYEPQFHAALLARKAPAADALESASWFLEQWDRNYAHWLEWHLPKIATLVRAGAAENLLLPPSPRYPDVVDRSLHVLGLQVGRLPRLTPGVVRVGQLTTVGIDENRPSLHRATRAAFRREVRRRDRKVFISRGRAGYRRLRNEEQCWEILQPLGYHKVFMEDLAFDEQIALMQEAIAVFSLHGAGLANILFAEERTQVIEVSDVSFPHPQIYALASCLGHDYWLIPGQPEGELRPGYHDVSADLEELRRAAELIERAL